MEKTPKEIIKEINTPLYILFDKIVDNIPDPIPAFTRDNYKEKWTSNIAWNRLLHELDIISFDDNLLNIVNFFTENKYDTKLLTREAYLDFCASCPMLLAIAKEISSNMELVIKLNCGLATFKDLNKLVDNHLDIGELLPYIKTPLAAQCIVKILPLKYHEKYNWDYCAAIEHGNISIAYYCKARNSPTNIIDLVKTLAHNKQSIVSLAPILSYTAECRYYSDYNDFYHIIDLLPPFTDNYDSELLLLRPWITYLVQHTQARENIATIVEKECFKYPHSYYIKITEDPCYYLAKLVVNIIDDLKIDINNEQQIITSNKGALAVIAASDPKKYNSHYKQQILILAFKFHMDETLTKEDLIDIFDTWVNHILLEAIPRDIFNDIPIILLRSNNKSQHLFNLITANYSEWIRLAYDSPKHKAYIISHWLSNKDNINISPSIPLNLNQSEAARYAFALYSIKNIYVEPLCVDEEFIEQFLIYAVVDISAIYLAEDLIYKYYKTMSCDWDYILELAIKYNVYYASSIIYILKRITDTN